jgi:hypothetical protein
MAGDSQDGMPGGLGRPQGTFDPAGKLVGPEQVPQGGPGGYLGDYSGGVVPGKNPGGGGQRGGGMSDFKVDKSLAEGGTGTVMIIGATSVNGKKVAGPSIHIENKDGSGEIHYYDVNEQYVGTETHDSTGRTTGYIFPEKEVVGGGGAASAGGFSDTGKKPWGPIQQKMYQRAKGMELMSQLLHGKAIDSSGGLPVDPDRTAQGSEGAGSSQSDKSQAGQAPQSAVPYVGTSPGAGLIGPTADENSKKPVTPQIVVPKGFLVVDPARKTYLGASLGRLKSDSGPDLQGTAGANTQ